MSISKGPIPVLILPSACLRIAAVFMLLPEQVMAAEGGIGPYLLGMNGPSAAVTPDPGWYFQNDIYYYSGSIGRGRDLPMNGRFSFGVDGSAFLAIPTLIYVTPVEIAGGAAWFHGGAAHRAQESRRCLIGAGAAWRNRRRGRK